MAAPIGDPTLVHLQRVMLGNLLINGVRLVWATVGPNEDMLPVDGLYPTMGHTLWAKGTDQQDIATSMHHQLLALGDKSCIPVPTIIFRVHRNVGREC
jgi:hypothetical protein